MLSLSYPFAKGRFKGSYPLFEGQLIQLQGMHCTKPVLSQRNSYDKTVLVQCLPLRKPQRKVMRNYLTLVGRGATTIFFADPFNKKTTISQKAKQQKSSQPGWSKWALSLFP